MAPGATLTETLSQPTNIILPTKSDISSTPENHVHGGEGLTPLEAISHGSNTLPGIPTFSTHQEHREHILIHMAAVFRNFARSGFTEGMSGHISVRDPEFDNYIWMNTLGRHFSLLTATDFVCLDINTGAVVGGNKLRPANAAGFLIHSEVHKARPDIHAVCHAHTMAGRAWSTFAKPLDMLTQDVCNFYNAHAVYAAYGGIVFASEEGQNIAKALGKHNKGVILMNHGLLTVGHTVDEAGYMFGLLDRSCRIQLDVEQAVAANPGLKKNIISDEEAAYNFKMASDKDSLYGDAQPDLEVELDAAGDIIAKGVDTMKIF